MYNISEISLVHARNTKSISFILQINNQKGLFGQKAKCTAFTIVPVVDNAVGKAFHGQKMKEYTLLVEISK